MPRGIYERATHIQLPWTDAETARLRNLWAEGLSASQIAKALNTGRSRNAIIGRVHRIGLAGRATPNKRAPTPRAMRERRRTMRPTFKETHPAPLTSDLQAIRDMAPLDPSLSVLKLSRFTCRHPIGDPKDGAFAFCGRTCEDTYCAQHAKLNYVAIQRRTRVERSVRDWLDSRDRRQAVAL